MHKSRIVTTRQAPLAQILAKKISALPWAVGIACPFIAIEQTISKNLNNLNDIDNTNSIKNIKSAFLASDLVIFTSSNAVASIAKLISLASVDRPNLTIAAIGDATMQSLIKHGCKQVITPKQTPFNSETLLQELQHLSIPIALGLNSAVDFRLKGNGYNKHIATIFTGENSRALLKNDLRKLGFEVNCITCYRRVIPEDSSRDFLAIADSGGVDAILLTCETSLRALTAVVNMNLPELLLTGSLITASQRITNAAIALGWKKIYTANGASDNDMLDVLQQFQPQTIGI